MLLAQLVIAWHWLDRPLLLGVSKLPFEEGERIGCVGCQRNLGDQFRRWHHRCGRRSAVGGRNEVQFGLWSSAKLFEEPVEVEEVVDPRRRPHLDPWSVWRHYVFNALDLVLEVGVVLRQFKGFAIQRQGLRQLSPLLEDFGQGAIGGGIVGGRLENQVEFDLGLVQPAELNQGSTERHARREAIGVVLQSGATDANGIVIGARLSALFRQLRKSDRRRVRLEPASQFQQPWIVVDHGVIIYDTVKLVDFVAVLPLLSVTTTVTV